MALTPEQKARKIALLKEEATLLQAEESEGRSATGIGAALSSVRKPQAEIDVSSIPGREAPVEERLSAAITARDVAEGGEKAKLKGIFPRLTPEQQLESPFAEAGAKTGRDIVSIPANFFNQLLLNAPRSLVEKAGFEFPSETENIVAKIAGKTAGVTGAIKTPILKGARALATKAIPFKALAGRGATKAIGRGAIEGATVGAALSPEDFTDIKQRGGQALFGGFLGGGIRAAGAGARGTRGLFRKGLGKFKEAKAGKVAKEKIVQLRRDIEDANVVLKSTIETVKTKAKALQSKINAEMTILESQIEDDVAREAGKLSSKTQGAAKRFIKENSKIYGEKLDAIEQKLTPDQQAAFTVDNIVSIVEQSTDEAAEALITEGAGINALNKIVESFSSGKGGAGLKKLLNVVKLAKRSVSAGAKTGKEGFSADDIPIEIFRKNVGLFLESIGVEDVAALNKGYSPVMELTKKVNAVFKPFKGALETGSGEQVFRRVLGGKPQLAAEKELIKRLKTGEKGFAKGIGDIDKAAKKAIGSLRERVLQLESRGQKISAIEKKKIVSETRALTKAVADKKLDIRKLQDIARTGQDAAELLKKAGITAGALTGTGLVGFAVKKILSGFKKIK